MHKIAKVDNHKPLCSLFGREVANILVPLTLITISYGMLYGTIVQILQADWRLYTLVPCLAIDALPFIYVMLMHFKNFSSDHTLQHSNNNNQSYSQDRSIILESEKTSFFFGDGSQFDRSKLLATES